MNRRDFLRLLVVGGVVAARESNPFLKAVFPGPDLKSLLNYPAPELAPAPVPTVTLSASNSFEPTPVPAPEAAPDPQPRVIAEVNTGLGSEPSIAVSPYDENLVAMGYNYVALHAGIPQNGIRISQDGGKTWKEVAREPWRGQGYPDYHGVVAWGPGEQPGSSRLWWVDAVIRGNPAPGNDRYQTVAYSDDLGKNWNFHVFKDTPPWIGGFPNLTVDNNPESPNFGTTYVAYNWLESAKGPGLAVAASKDGKNWQVTQVPAPEDAAGYPDYWRINYKPKATSTGVDVLFYQTNTKNWNKNDPFSEGRKGETAYYLAQLSFDEKAKLKVDNVLPAPDLKGVSWGSVYDPETQNGFAIDHNDVPWMAFTSAGKIIIGNMSDSRDQLPWMEFSLSGTTCFKPSLAVGKNYEIFVGFHAVKNGRVGTYFMVSYDNGQNWTSPQLVTRSTWRFSSLPKDSNGTGLREGIDVSPNGNIYYTYADNRNGRLSAYVAIIDLGRNKAYTPFSSEHPV